MRACVVEAFEVPARDRFQTISEHKARQMIIQDVGLGFERTERVIVVQVTTTPRTLAVRKNFCCLAASYLQNDCGLSQADLNRQYVASLAERFLLGDQTYFVYCCSIGRAGGGLTKNTVRRASLRAGLQERLRESGLAAVAALMVSLTVR